MYVKKKQFAGLVRKFRPEWSTIMVQDVGGTGPSNPDAGGAGLF